MSCWGCLFGDVSWAAVLNGCTVWLGLGWFVLGTRLLDWMRVFTIGNGIVC